jgi:hypothetical protein
MLLRILLDISDQRFVIPYRNRVKKIQYITITMIKYFETNKIKV